MIDNDGNLITVTFDHYGLADYPLFLKCKGLPESRISYDWESDKYQITTPARFAQLLGVEEIGKSHDDVPFAPHLFDYQQYITQKALTAKRFAVWADTGLGKTPIYLEWARQVMHRTDAKVLILTPLQIIPQVQEMAQAWYGAELPIIRQDTREHLQAWCKAPGMQIGICNYEKLIDDVMPELRYLGGVVADECFAPDTPVDVAVRDGYCVRTIQKSISTVRVGDRIRNVVAADTVADVHRREVHYAVRVAFGGHTVICSPNHPWFTRRGYVCAQDLIPGDRLMATTAVVRLVRSALCGEEERSGDDAILRSILLSEMADESAGDSGEGAHERGTRQDRSEGESVAALTGSASDRQYGEDSSIESYVGPGEPGEVLPHIESHAPQTFRAWGQWPGLDETSADSPDCTWRRLDSGIRFVTGPTDSQLSIELQARLSAARVANRYRGGWALSSLTKDARPEEGRQARFTGVESLEVLEPGHPDLERYRDADGHIYFYDLGATQHPSFSVFGYLVHNSSILKSGGGVIKWNLIKSARGIEYKLSCTATPAPNDTMEYASQASFLEKLRSEGEILWTYFTRDKNGAWRVKPHAREAFYRFMASWSIYMRNPAHFGFKDILSTLPAPDVREYELGITDAQRDRMFGLLTRANKGLFTDDRMGVTERSKLSQIAKGFIYHGGRTGKTEYIESVKPRFVADLVRKDVADGRQVLVWTVFDEESDIIRAELGGSTFTVATLHGDMSDDARAQTLQQFRTGQVDVLISKAQLVGYGLNLQFCRSMVFSGFDDSFERMYQAIRRCYRFGQTEVVRVHVPFIPALEGMIFNNVKQKEMAFIRDVDIQEKYYREALREDLDNATKNRLPTN